MIKRLRELLLWAVIYCFMLVCAGNCTAHCLSGNNSQKILFCIWNTAVAMQGKHGDAVSSADRRLQGSSVYKINLCKKLVKAGIPVVALIINDAELEKECNDLGCQCYGFQLSGKKRSTLAAIMKMICEKENIALIHCHDPFETTEALVVAREYPVKIIKTVHVDANNGGDYLKHVDGILCVSAESEAVMKKLNQAKKFNIKQIAWTPPFFDEDRFLQFVPAEDKKLFFKREFGIELKACPMICSVANFYSLFKNHMVLLKAVATLMYEYHQPVQLVLAGIGPRLEEMKQLAKDLYIDDYVYFVGHTTKTPELYYYSDINALTSNAESLGIVLLEGALLKKPLIGTAGTGMEAVVKDGQTGFLFHANNVDELAAQIKKLLDEPSLAASLGQNAYDFVMKNFLSDVSVQKIISFYDAVLGSVCASGIN